MTDFFWPQQLVPSSSSWSLVSNTSVFTSPLSGTTRTLGRSGDRWRCSLTFDNLRDDKRAILQAFLAQLRGQANRVYYVDHAYRKRGSFDASNLLPDFSSATPWTTVVSTLTVADGVGRITASSGAASYRGINRSVTVVNGAFYAVRGFFVRSSTGTASMSAEMLIGSGFIAAGTSAGLKTTSGTSTSTSGTAYFTVDSTGSSAAAGDYADIAYASMARCIRVNGASQTGSSVAVTALGNTADGILLPGDRVEINGGYHMVTDRLDSTASSTSKLQITPPLRSSPADNAPVIVHDPACRMMLADNTVSWSNAPGRFSSFTVELIEDLL